MSKGKSKAANNQRSNVKNPNHLSYTADRANRIQQGHKNVPAQPITKPAVTNLQK
ncbi:MAG: hypothetical protein KC766_02585 [Myxococcales bacterium]|nr:hypothetical protein [Myxococcales bacterium]